MTGFELFISILTSVAGCVGFAMVWNMENKYIPYAAVIAFITWGSYLLSSQFMTGEFLPTLIATLAAVFVSEGMARMTRKNASQYRISGIVCLIPGSGLYNTMSSLIRSDTEAMHRYAASTAYTVFGIAGGICLGSAILYMFRVILDKNRDTFSY